MLICGEVALLRQEALTAIRKQAQAAGFDQRKSYQIDSGFNWAAVFTDLENLALFRERLLIEITHLSGKFDAQVTQQLIAYFERPSADIVLVIITDKLSASQQKARWYQSLQKNGVVHTLKPISKNHLPVWISERARQRGISLARESIALLAELTEGNLLATQQALDKLALLYPKKTMTPAMVTSVISDSTQFNVFDLSPLLLCGELPGALRVLRGLINHQIEPTLILWVLCHEIREVAKLIVQQQQGIPLQTLLAKQWASRRSALQRALKRLSLAQLDELLLLASQADQIIKGVRNGNIRDILETLVIRYCGKSVCHA